LAKTCSSHSHCQKTNGRYSGFWPGIVRIQHRFLIFHLFVCNTCTFVTMVYLRQWILILSVCVIGATTSDNGQSKLLRRSGTRNLQKLTFRGNNPTVKLSQCEGDCDRDSDCVSGLVCYEKGRGGTGKVPGCSGTDTSSTDFCVDPGKETNCRSIFGRVGTISVI